MLVAEEWCFKKDGYITHFWEDQLCRDLRLELCSAPQFQHLRGAAMLIPCTQPSVCPISGLLHVSPDGITLLWVFIGPLNWLNARSSQLHPLDLYMTPLR